MKTYSIQEASKHLDRLVEKAAEGESFLISADGKPLVKVLAFSECESIKSNRFGFMKDQIQVPDDFDQMERQVIQRLFR